MDAGTAALLALDKMADATADNAQFDFADAVIRYESGEMNDEEMINLFQYLIDNGMIAHFQGSYGRTAQILLDMGLIG
jgi:hypothetical protein